ncbi:hypothetical protein NDU88_007055, partial [Pleurodeles waltl]
GQPPFHCLPQVRYSSSHSRSAAPIVAGQPPFSLPPPGERQLQPLFSLPPSGE